MSSRRPIAAGALALAVLMTSRVEGAQPISVALVVDATDAPSLGARVRGAVRGVLEHDPRLTLKLLDIGIEEAPNPLEAADAAVVKAERAFKEMDLDPARAAIEEAIKIYEEHLAALAAREQGTRALRDAQIVLAKIRFFESNPEGAKDVLRRAFALDPKLVFRGGLFPAQMKRVVVEARLLFETLGSARVTVSSEPAGAAVSLNGKATGQKTPAVLDVYAGPNSFSVQLAGHVTAQHGYDVGAQSNKGEPALNFRLERADSMAASGHEAALAWSRGTPISVDLDRYAAALGVDALVFVHVAEPVATRARLLGGVFLRPRPTKSKTPPAVVNVLEGTVERGGSISAIEGDAEAIGRALDESLLEHQPAVAAAEPSRGGGGWQRFRSSKAFWYVVGGVAGAVLVGAGVGVGVGLGEQQRRDTAREVVLLGGR